MRHSHNDWAFFESARIDQQQSADGKGGRGHAVHYGRGVLFQRRRHGVDQYNTFRLFKEFILGGFGTRRQLQMSPSG